METKRVAFRMASGVPGAYEIYDSRLMGHDSIVQAFMQGVQDWDLGFGGYTQGLIRNSDVD